MRKSRRRVEKIKIQRDRTRHVHIVDDVVGMTRRQLERRFRNQPLNAMMMWSEVEEKKKSFEIRWFMKCSSMAKVCRACE